MVCFTQKVRQMELLKCLCLWSQLDLPLLMINFLDSPRREGNRIKVNCRLQRSAMLSVPHQGADRTTLDPYMHVMPRRQETAQREWNEFVLREQPNKAIGD